MRCFDPWSVRPSVAGWVALVLLVPCITAVAVHFGDAALAAGGGHDEPLSFELICYGKLVLGASSMLYVLHLGLTAPVIGRWATALAAAGTLDVGVGLMVRAAEPAMPSAGAVTQFSSVYEVLLVFTVILMTLYLMMEAEYRSRVAGAVVVPAMSLLTAFELWLVGIGTAEPASLLPIMRMYWNYASVAVSVTGYLLLGAGALIAGLYIVREVSEANGGLREAVAQRLPDLATLEHLLVRSKMVGLAMLVAAAVLWEGWSLQLERKGVFQNPIEPWVFVLICAYAVFLGCRARRRWSPQRTASWAITLFGASIVALAGINLAAMGGGA